MRIWSEYARKEGLVFVLSGPSGVGKDVVISEFLHLGNGVKKCVTCTMRPKRDNEVDSLQNNVSIDIGSPKNQRSCKGCSIYDECVRGEDGKPGKVGSQTYVGEARRQADTAGAGSVQGAWSSAAVHGAGVCGFVKGVLGYRTWLLRGQNVYVMREC